MKKNAKKQFWQITETPLNYTTNIFVLTFWIKFCILSFNLLLKYDRLNYVINQIRPQSHLRLKLSPQSSALKSLSGEILLNVPATCTSEFTLTRAERLEIIVIESYRYLFVIFRGNYCDHADYFSKCLILQAVPDIVYYIN